MQVKNTAVKNTIIVQENPWMKGAIAFIVLLTVLRIILLFLNGLPLYADEAQYWIWSKHLEFGYYSKPPMIAAIISLSTELFGDAEYAVRFFSPIIHMFTSCMVFILGSRLFGSIVGALSALIFITLPSIFLSSLLISTDVPLMFLWALALYYVYKALEENKFKDWCAVGICVGLGLMTKYHFILIAPATVIYSLWIGRLKPAACNVGPYIATLIALLIFAPNLYWNWQNGFASFMHVQDLAGVKTGFDFYKIPMALLKFIGNQLVVFGIFLLPFTMMNIVSKNALSKEVKFLSSYMLTVIFCIMFFAIKNKAHANWTAPAYVSGSILAAYLFVSLGKISWAKYNIVAHCGLGLIIILAPFFMDTIPDKTFNPLNRVKGYAKLGESVAELKSANAGAVMATDDRKLYALMVYYGRPYLYDLKKFNDHYRVDDHFDLTAPLDTASNPIIMISKYMSEESLRQIFTNSQVAALPLDNSMGHKAFLISR
ncbi:MAG: glycosyltransferase family 39 protein [Candidatus Jidaibacter sp.]|jgi:hypothetical protein|nr:glycosyltransferase family 39 protein [Candidatus Jidaibacter sp.]